jgi:hypothetical protein
VSTNGVAYYLTAPGGWIIAKSSVRDVWQYTLWRSRKRYPADGPGYASAKEAMAVADAEEAK